MKYRALGNTGIEVSEIGMGGEHLDGKPYEQTKAAIDAALEAGVNIIDVFMPGDEIRGNIVKALGSRRKNVYIQGHIGSTDINQQYDISRDMPTVQKYFENILGHYGYIDLGMLFFIDSEEAYRDIFETDFAAYAQRLKEKGDIRHIGFSSHNPTIAKKVVETGLPEMMMFSINPAFDLVPADKEIFDVLDNGLEWDKVTGMDPERMELYRLCQQKGVGITVMKTFGAGKLLSKEHSPFESPMSPVQCIHYALTRPAVASTLIGFQTPEEVAEAMKYYTVNDESRDYSRVISSLKNDFKGECVYCNHCLPCPSEIDIAALTKYLDIARLDEENIPPSIKSHYNALLAHGSDCIECGSCMEKCPFSVEVIGNMKDADRIFGL